MVIWRRKTSISSKRKRGFCGGSRDNIEHFIGEYNNTKEWFNELGSNRRERVCEKDLRG